MRHGNEDVFGVTLTLASLLQLCETPQEHYSHVQWYQGAAAASAHYSGVIGYATLEHEETPPFTPPIPRFKYWLCFLLISMPSSILNFPNYF